MTDALRRKIFVGCRELGLDGDARRDLQRQVTGKSSLTKMNEVELKLVLNRLKADGFKERRSGKRAAAPRADLRIVHVLWRKLGQAGALRDPTRAGLNAFIQKRFGDAWGFVPADIDMLREHTQIDDVVQALKNWGERADIDFDWEDHRR